MDTYPKHKFMGLKNIETNDTFTVGFERGKFVEIE